MKTIINISISIFLIITAGACVYFNTYYNAINNFEDAEKEVLKLEDISKMNKSTVDRLNKTIDKCQTILDKYPDTKYKDDALFLMSRAYFYKGHYSKSKQLITQLTEDETTTLKNESQLWLAKCNWKLYDYEIADLLLNQLIIKLSKNLSKQNKNLLAHSYNTKAEIFLENKMPVDSVLFYYNKSADNYKNKSDKTRVYEKAAILSFDNSLYSESLNVHKKIVKYSSDPEKVEKSQLSIVHLYRLQQEWDESNKAIKTLLTDEKYLQIYPDIYLEKAKLYEDQERFDNANEGYLFIIDEYPKTESSAESSYQLGMIQLKVEKKYTSALEYFEKVEEEKKSSLFTKEANKWEKRINSLFSLKTQINNVSATLDSLQTITPVEASNDTFMDSTYVDSTTVDTTIVDSMIVESKAETDINRTEELQMLYGDLLFSLGGLFAFQFNEPDSAIPILDTLIRQFSDSPKRSQAMYTLSHLLSQRGEEEQSTVFKDKILVEYPLSEYSQKILNERGEEFFDPILEIFKKAESAKDENIDESINLYLSITHEYPESEYSPAALMAIGDIYDNLLGNLDSSLTSYENLIHTYPESPQTQFVKKRYNQLLAYKASLMDTASVSDSTNIDSIKNELPLLEIDRLDMRIPPGLDNFEAVEVDED